jgi:predicted RecA/RadA family phage recombinase
VATTDIAISGTGVIEGGGAFELTAASADTWGQGEELFWDATNARLTTTAQGGQQGPVFLARAAKTNGQTTAEVNFLHDSDPTEAARVTITNSTGGTLAAGAVFIERGIAHIVRDAIANSASGLAYTGGVVRALAAATADTWSRGARLGWDRSNSRLTTLLEQGSFFEALADKTNGQTTALVALRNYRECVINRLATAGEDSANAATWDTGLGSSYGSASLGFQSIVIFNASNVQRLPAGGWAWHATNGTVTVTDANLAATERVVGSVRY